jgi:AcrR family transcriptional regulator
VCTARCGLHLGPASWTTTEIAGPQRSHLNRPKRKRREQEALSDEQISSATLDLIRREGTDRFSMRMLAKELGVTPMAVYYYVPNKDALFERVTDAVLARIPRPEPSRAQWREQMKAAAVNGFRLLSEYSGMSAQIVKRPPSRQSDELARYGISILLAAGFDARVATKATLAVQAFMFGMIAIQAQFERTQRRKRRSRPEDLFFSKLDVNGLVEFGFDALLAGLDEVASRAPRPKPARTVSTRRSLARTAMLKA